MKIAKLRRPGVEISIKAAPKKESKARGTVIINYPLSKCPDDGFVIVSRDSTVESVIGAEDAKLRKLVSRALNYCKEVIIVQSDEATHATTDVTVESAKITLGYKFSGTEGNSVTVTVKANSTKFDVVVKLGGRVLEEMLEVATWEDVTNLSKFLTVEFGEVARTTALVAKEHSLTGGTSPEITVGGYAKFLEQIRVMQFNVLVTPLNITEGVKDIEDMSTLLVKEMRDDDENLDTYLVTTETSSKHAKSNSEFKYIVNQTGLSYGVDEKYTDSEVKFIFGAVVAGVEPNESLTNYDMEAVGVINPMFPIRIEDALAEGYTMFYRDQKGKIRIVKDQTSFVEVVEGDERPETFTDGMVVRITDAVVMFIKEHFTSEWIGKQPCTEDSAKLYKDVVYSILGDFQKKVYLQNVSPDDVVVELADNARKMFVMNLGLQPIEAVEKLYISTEVK